MRPIRFSFHSRAVSKVAGIQFVYAAPPPPGMEHSPWRSPVPYLFGGLAAMLGLIAFALLLLGCAYWKLFGGEEIDAARDGAVEEKSENSSDAKESSSFEDKFLVIMAGDVRPTFLAIPASPNRASVCENSIQATSREQENPIPKNQNEIQQQAITIHESGESSQEN
ncbi:protein GLUTAMINE DUMPER 5-like [Andrographis paniculata]|uniref:protein GLUTAMINE DUMPER 5-like n=1 Tax=Andrographis paniculata TaxID=175694 RepID=UPI0021E8C9E7|nr:protein GLUTAMINE DUMPER 5-like [Andrographis paniculata]